MERWDVISHTAQVSRRKAHNLNLAQNGIWSQTQILQTDEKRCQSTSGREKSLDSCKCGSDISVGTRLPIDRLTENLLEEANVHF